MYMDLTYDPEQNDSGMESLTASKDDTPERRPEDSFITPVLGTSPSALTPVSAGPLKEYDDVNITFIFIKKIGGTKCVNIILYIGTLIVCNRSGVKSLYGLSRSVMWILASSSVILFAPVIFEVERAQVEEMQKSQQKQVLLGTNTALSGPMPNMPPMPR
ncbi:hypothetical protein RR48_12334 [Papilio machaon]|uniref:Mitochondrial import receptor subunit TOM22 homolog n=1 Tax=Papilio machaon TaxID=76193 RepID=A0A194QYC9_PAPMA|nr:hypothetical protein RR48_12334 [Papilio machaon]